MSGLTLREMTRGPLHERRLRRYNVHPDMLITYLRAMEHWPNCFGRAVITDLPEDAKVLEVFYDVNRRCLGVIVSHPSFEEVPDGAEVPMPMQEYAAINIGWVVKQPDGNYRTTNDKQEAFSQLKETTIAERATRNPIAASGNESSREWFQREMKRTD